LASAGSIIYSWKSQYPVEEKGTRRELTFKLASVNGTSSFRTYFKNSGLNDISMILESNNALPTNWPSIVKSLVLDLHP
jgi:hypothetical protein